MIFCGIDISMKTFDVALLINDSYKNKLFSNDLKGIKSFHQWFKSIKQEVIFCMEATEFTV